MVSFSLYWDLKVKVKCTILNGDLPFGFLAWLWGPLSLIIDWYNYWSSALGIFFVSGSLKDLASLERSACIIRIVCAQSVMEVLVRHIISFFLSIGPVLFKLCCYGLWQVSNVDLHDPCVLEWIINLHTGYIILWINIRHVI